MRLGKRFLWAAGRVYRGETETHFVFFLFVPATLLPLYGVMLSLYSHWFLLLVPAGVALWYFAIRMMNNWTRVHRPHRPHRSSRPTVPIARQYPVSYTATIGSITSSYRDRSDGQ